jgi:peptidoglycan/xylan/chitin deacetylase (PgdA/CDA1 family)
LYVYRLLILPFLFLFFSFQFGLDIKGVINSFNPHNKKLVALTLDACSGKVDKELINFLIKNNIKATLFLSGRWLNKHEKLTKKLSEISIFEIENHGLLHKPLTVHGEKAYGISGTKSKEEAYNEIKKNEEKIFKITGVKTKFFRSGTAHYDTEGIKIAHKLGYKIIGFTINGDYGATAKKNEIVKNIMANIKPGSIIISHMNHPEGETFEGLKPAIILLKKRGYKFVKLEEVIK